MQNCCKWCSNLWSR